MNHKGKPLSNLNNNTPNIALENRLILYFITGPNSYKSFRKALTNKLINHAAKHTLELLLQPIASN